MPNALGRAVCVNIARMCSGVTNDVQLLFMVVKANGCIFMVYKEYMDDFMFKVLCLIMVGLLVICK